MFSIVLTDICRSFLRVSKVTEKIKTRSKPTPSENFNSHPLHRYVCVALSVDAHTMQITQYSTAYSIVFVCKGPFG
jgi:hypothetical protein